MVYKIDRLSRSIADFVQLMAKFDKHGVAFAAVTQQFDTSTPVGRLTLNLLTCFAQFERETIAERTRDKVHAARRRGKWTGGPPPLGYDVVPEGGRIVVNEDEAKRVRRIFALHAEHETVTHTVQDLNARGWRTKSWTTRAGHVREGVAWTKCTLRKLLANPTYIGRVKLKGEVFEGEHPAIVDPDVFEHAQELLARGLPQAGEVPGRAAQQRAPRRAAPLRALQRRHDPGLHPAREEGVPLLPLPDARRRRAGRPVRTPRSATHEIEALVVEQIRAIGRDAKLQARVLEAVRKQDPEVDPADLRRALTLFDPVWEVLHAREQARILKLLIEGISFDGAAGTAVVAFRATGIQALAEEIEA